ncbi:MAG: hypothetical protein WKF30_11980 [Pyrinomonadaceae bacterium]
MLSTDALSVLIPVLEEIVGVDAASVRALFESYGFLIQEWDKVRTDRLTFSEILPRQTSELSTTSEAGNWAEIVGA